VGGECGGEGERKAYDLKQTVLWKRNRRRRREKNKRLRKGDSRAGSSKKDFREMKGRTAPKTVRSAKWDEEKTWCEQVPRGFWGGKFFGHWW